ncbi:unnamed protein product [Heterosigma akashiwo]
MPYPQSPQQAPPPPPPPPPPAGPGATRLRLQLPHGAKVDRRFDADAPLRVVGDFIDVHFADNEIEIENYSVSTNFPKRTFAELGAETLRAAGCTRRPCSLGAGPGRLS